MSIRKTNQTRLSLLTSAICSIPQGASIRWAAFCGVMASAWPLMNVARESQQVAIPGWCCIFCETHFGDACPAKSGLVHGFIWEHHRARTSHVMRPFPKLHVRRFDVPATTRCVVAISCMMWLLANVPTLKRRLMLHKRCLQWRRDVGDANLCMPRTCREVQRTDCQTQ